MVVAPWLLVRGAVGRCNSLFYRRLVEALVVQFALSWIGEHFQALAQQLEGVGE